MVLVGKRRVAKTRGGVPIEGARDRDVMWPAAISLVIGFLPGFFSHVGLSIEISFVCPLSPLSPSVVICFQSLNCLSVRLELVERPDASLMPAI